MKYISTSARVLLVVCSLTMAIAVAACPPGSVVPVSGPDAGDAGGEPPLDAHAATLYQRACSNLARLGCAEGAEKNCSTTLEHAQTARLSDFKPECLATASSKTAVRDCCKGAAGACSRIACL